MSNPSPNIVRSADGRYCWFYEFKLLKNPSGMFLLLKLFFWAVITIWLLLSMINLFEGHFLKDFLKLGKVMLIILAAVECLTLAGYFVYAAIHGFRYCIIYEMDEEGIMHTRMLNQFKRAQAVSAVAALAGVVPDSPDDAGPGMQAATRQSLRSTWKSARRVMIDPGMNLIKIHEKTIDNQIYAEDADFRFVAEYIRSHVSPKCKVKEKEIGTRK